MGKSSKKSRRHDTSNSCEEAQDVLEGEVKRKMKHKRHHESGSDSEASADRSRKRHRSDKRRAPIEGGGDRLNLKPDLKIIQKTLRHRKIQLYDGDVI